jgi:hypothetical protein
MIKEGGKDAEERIIFGFRAATARRPSPQEIKIMTDTLEDMLQTYEQDTGATQALLKVGESAIPEGLKEPELAAYTAVANVLLNLNEAITR